MGINDIRKHKHSLDYMKKYVWAIYYHKLSNDEYLVLNFKKMEKACNGSERRIA